MAVIYHPFERRQQAVIACDMGKLQDHTAVCVLEKEVVGTGEWELGPGEHSYEQSETFIRGRALLRLPLGMSYVDQISAIAAMYGRVPAPRKELLLDSTGLGEPIADLFDDAGLRPIRVTITAGEGVNRVGPRDYRVSKLVLVSGLEAGLHTGALKIARNVVEGEALKEELRDFERHVTQAGHTTFSGRVGKHDDLVLSVAIAYWRISRPQPIAKEVKIVGW